MRCCRKGCGREVEVKLIDRWYCDVHWRERCRRLEK